VTYLYAYMTNTIAQARMRLQDEEGQTMAEYGVVLAVITIAIVTTLGLLSGAIQGALSRVIDVLDGAGAGS
jgi:pilus assembly protein Flp/PilA